MKTRLALLLLLVAAAACKVDNNASVRVEHVCAIPDDCKFGTGGCTATYIGQIAVDLFLTDQMMLFLQVDNLLPDNTNTNTNRTNTNDAFLKEYVIEYAGFPATFTGPITGSATVLAKSSTVISVDVVNPTVAALALPYIPATTGELAAVARVRLKGVLADGSSFETGVYEVRFLACYGTGCADIVPPVCTAPAVLSFCPNFGQLPTLGICVGG